MRNCLMFFALFQLVVYSLSNTIAVYLKSFRHKINDKIIQLEKISIFSVIEQMLGWNSSPNCVKRLDVDQQMEEPTSFKMTSILWETFSRQKHARDSPMPVEVTKFSYIFATDLRYWVFNMKPQITEVENDILRAICMSYTNKHWNFICGA